MIDPQILLQESTANDQESAVDQQASQQPMDQQTSQQGRRQGRIRASLPLRNSKTKASTRGRTNSYGKDGKKHQPRRRRRIRNDAGSYQSSHAREAVGERYFEIEFNALIKNHTWDLIHRSKGTKNYYKQMGSQAQEKRNRTDRQVEDKIDGKGIQSDLRSRLSRYLCTSGQARINQDTSRNRSNLWIGDSSDGCRDSIFSRGIGGRNIHGTVRRIRSRNQGGRSRMQTQNEVFMV